MRASAVNNVLNGRISRGAHAHWLPVHPMNGGGEECSVDGRRPASLQPPLSCTATQIQPSHWHKSSTGIGPSAKAPCLISDMRQSPVAPPRAQSVSGLRGRETQRRAPRSWTTATDLHNVNLYPESQEAERRRPRDLAGLSDMSTARRWVPHTIAVPRPLPLPLPVPAA